MKACTFAVGVLVAVSHVAAHMRMEYPPPLRSKSNPFSGQDIDYSDTTPLSGSGSDFPCKGALKVFDTDAGKPVAEWKAGSSYNMTITGGAAHNGGSCQASLSFDKGKTFKVIHSYIGGCPLQSSTFDFTLPNDTPSGKALFAWTWFNNLGNREMYMNCASVMISGGSPGKRDAGASFSSRPDIFVANVGNGCKTQETKDVDFPSPGPDVTKNSNAAAPPAGDCGSAAPAPPADGSGAGSGSDAKPKDGASPPSASATAPASTTPAPLGPKPDAPEPSKAASSSASVRPVPTELTIIEILPTASSNLGGVFATVPPESPTPTTLATITNPNAAPKPTPAEPAPAPVPTKGTDSPGGTGTQAIGTPCQPEGTWNCLGSGFQRCASGQWSQVIQMAQGTSCKPGLSENLVMLKKRGGARIVAI